MKNQVLRKGWLFVAVAIISCLVSTELLAEGECVPPPSGMVSWWPGDGSADDIIGDNPGEAQPTVTFPDGVVGPAFGFDGVGAFVHVPDSDSLDITNAISIDAWIKPLTEGNSDGTTFVMLKGDNTVRTTQSYGLVWAGQSIFFRLGSTDDIDQLSADIPLDIFTHVAGVYDGETISVYTNGVLAASKPSSLGALQNTGAPLIIGSSLRSGSLTDFFHGVVDEIEIFNRALSAEEIAAIFNAGSAGKCKPCIPPPSGMVAWWPGDGNANDIVDGNNGSPEGGLSFTAGKVAEAFSFNGTDADVKIPAAPSLDVGAGDGMTIDLWINPADVGSPQPLVEWNNGFTFGAHLWISETCCGGGLGNIYANLRDAGFGTHIIQSGSNLVTAATYQHVALTYDKTTGIGSIYLDGNLVAQQDMGVFTPNTVPDLYLGARVSSAGAARFGGAMDEVEIFNRALSSNEIAAIFNAGSAGKCKPGTPPVLACSLAPAVDTNQVDLMHTVTVTVTTNSSSAAGASVSFDVTGANSAASTGHITDGNGQASFTYTGNVAGTDTIRAIATLGELSTTCTATKVWIQPPAEVHDLALVSLKAPKNINLKGAEPSLTKRVKVQLQNRSPHNETIPNLDTLRELVEVEIVSLGLCSAPEAVLIPGPPNVVPRTLKPKQKMNVFFDVTYRCANDPAKGPGHEDYRYTARVNHAALDGNPDTHTADDDCPRPPLPGGVDNEAGLGIKDTGCAGNAPVLTDVVVK
jgi:hypothetical protein